MSTRNGSSVLIYFSKQYLDSIITYVHNVFQEFKLRFFVFQYGLSVKENDKRLTIRMSWLEGRLAFYLASLWLLRLIALPSMNVLLAHCYRYFLLCQMSIVFSVSTLVCFASISSTSSSKQIPVCVCVREIERESEQVCQSHPLTKP